MKNGNEGMSNLAEIENLNKQIYQLKKEMALVREHCQIELLQKDKKISDLVNINVEHQKLNGELRKDNKKLTKQIDDYVNKLRKAGLV